MDGIWFISNGWLKGSNTPENSIPVYMIVYEHFISETPWSMSTKTLITLEIYYCLYNIEERSHEPCDILSFLHPVKLFLRFNIFFKFCVWVCVRLWVCPHWVLVSSELYDVEWPESRFTSGCEPLDNNSGTWTLLLCKWHRYPCRYGNISYLLSVMSFPQERMFLFTKIGTQNIFWS